MFLRCGWIEILLIGCGIAINSLYFYYFLITSCWKVSKQWKWQHTESQIKSPFLRWNWGLLSFRLLPFRFWLMFMDINESVGTQIAKTMGPRHCRSDSGEGGMSFIINFLLQHSNALNKIKEHRACVVIYFLDLQPTVKIISKKTISPLLSLSEFKWQNFWARLSGTRAPRQKNAMAAKPFSHRCAPGGMTSKHASFENRVLPFNNLLQRLSFWPRLFVSHRTCRDPHGWRRAQLGNLGANGKSGWTGCALWWTAALLLGPASCSSWSHGLLSRPLGRPPSFHWPPIASPPRPMGWHQLFPQEFSHTWGSLDGQGHRLQHWGGPCRGLVQRPRP